MKALSWLLLATWITAACVIAAGNTPAGTVFAGASLAALLAWCARFRATRRQP